MALLTMKGHPKMRLSPEMAAWYNTSENSVGAAEEWTWGEWDCQNWRLISLLGASNHGVSVGNLESNQLGACAEMRRVEESTADRLR